MVNKKNKNVNIFNQFITDEEKSSIEKMLGHFKKNKEYEGKQYTGDDRQYNPSENQQAISPGI